MSLIKPMSKKALDKKSEPEADGKNLAVALNMRRRSKHKMAQGGEAKDEVEDMPMNTVDAIMAKRMMAKGGEVDLQDNSDEQLNLEDQLSYEAARKDTYFDDSQLDEQPEDSNLHGDELSDADSHDMISKIMAKMRSKRS